ncbi:hypothetical protein EIP86_000860 [Pleurotus ostreatoroseus]|nr:hypothetical protein EIP86_000860 [Pleurotus ostreatoroseus]
MAKKKKTQLKPVVRGFATQSVPKKIVEVQPDAEPESYSSTVPSTSEEVPSAQTDVATTAATEANQFDAVKQAEERALQNIVDRHQDRTEKEIIRTVKIIEQERRFTASLPLLTLESSYVDQVLDLVKEASYTEDKYSIDEPEEKSITRLAITYGVLRRLGFSEDVVEECLRSINGVDLDEAYQWASDSPTAKLDYAFSEDESPTDDPNEKYVRLKMRIADLTTHRKPNETRDANFLKSLQRRLEQVKQDYFFDETEAEAVYRSERQKADAASLLSRLRQPQGPDSSHSPSPVDHKSSPQSPRQASRPDTPRNPPDISDENDIFDEEDNAPGGLFGLLEELPTTETTPEGAVIRVRDMALPKHWSGRTPRVLLLDTVKKVDKYAATVFQVISGFSRVKRAAVRIQWSHGRTSEWNMEDVACHDDAQAEQYIALVALHSLTFPPTAGFAVGGTSASANQTFFRVLPPVHRDLWDELEAKRRSKDDLINRTVWAKLKDILGPKLSTHRSTDHSEKPIVMNKFDPKVRSGMQRDISPEQIIADFEERRSRIEYQEMRFQRDTLPIAQYRAHILDALETSQVLVLSGETGCGKSTQIPSFILEDHLSKGRHCKIYCTEPRRISAISLANRVSRELGEPAGAVGTAGSLVGYSIRLESFTSKTTRLTFVTNGIALRMLEAGSGQGGMGSAFDEITHIIIDEVHERTIESDFLLIVLKSLVKQRPDLKVILMSATLNAEKFSKYFDGCPILQVPGRTFPVEVCYLEDAIEMTKWKVTEDSPYAIRGFDKYSRGKAKLEWSEDTALADDDDDEVIHENVSLEKRYSSSTAASINLLDERLVPYELIVRLLEHLCLHDSPYSQYSSAVLVFMPGMGEIRRLHEVLMDHRDFASEQRFRIYPLHSTIASDQQAAAFDIPPPGIRKIVIATNIAETGITIPDITCVVDTGRQREMR